jgi:pSer/pThr/pTyr-binding forkhead associated (FHA) protein
VIRCSVCKHEEYEGTLYCTECGNPLWDGTTRQSTAGDDSATTQRFEATELAGPGGGDGPGQESDPARSGDDPTQIVLRLQGNPQAIYLTGRDEYRLGRGDPRQGMLPDLDLGPFRALEMGVSRLHALLRRSRGTVSLTDLGSTNGTTVNGVRLAPNSPQPLRDGDELRLGKLALRIFFS